jgi:hypothetical protein
MYSNRTQREKDRLAGAMTEDIEDINHKKGRGNYSISRSIHGNWYSSSSII